MPVVFQSMLWCFCQKAELLEGERDYSCEKEEPTFKNWLLFDVGFSACLKDKILGTSALLGISRFDLSALIWVYLGLTYWNQGWLGIMHVQKNFIACM